jgi:uncharacterized protein YjcR
MVRMTAELWSSMRKDYEEGLYDLQELSELYELKLETVKKRANSEKWKRADNDRTVRRLKNHRIQILEAICSSTMEGLRKADDLLVECDNLKDVEVHSKTVKNYKDICIGKSPEEVFYEFSGNSPEINELNAELETLSAEDVEQIISGA